VTLEVVVELNEDGGMEVELWSSDTAQKCYFHVGNVS